MRFKLTLLLLVLNAALFSTLFYMDKHADSEREFQKQSSLVLPSGSIEQARSLKLEGPGAAVAWELRRTGRSWRMEKPQQWPLNSFAVENMLDQLRFLRKGTAFSIDEIERYGATLEDYGLDKPSLVLTVDSGSQTSVLRIGASTKVGGRFYLLSPEGDQVYVIGSELVQALMLDMDKLRNTHVFNLPPYTISSISVQRSDGVRVRLGKRAGGWEFESPIRVGADSAAVDSLLAELADLKVLSFAPQDPAEQGLLTPRMRLGLEAADQRQGLLIGSADSEGRVFAKLEDSPEVFRIDAALIDRLGQVQEVLRERRFNRFDSASVSELRVDMGNQSATLQKLETGEWQVLRPTDEGGVRTWKADGRIVGSLISALSAQRALRFVSDAPSEADLRDWGFADPQRKATIRSAAGTRTLLFGDLEPKLRGVYVMVQGEPFVYESSAAIIDQLRPVPLHYRSRLLESLPPAARLLRMRLVRVAEGETVLDLAPAAGQDWAGLLDSRPGDEGAALGVLLNFIRAGEAKNFVSDRFSPDLPLGDGKAETWALRLETDLELPSGTGQAQTRRMEYLFTKAIGGTTQFGASESLELVFTLPDELMLALHRLESRHVPPALPDEDEAEPSPAPQAEEAAGKAP